MPNLSNHRRRNSGMTNVAPQTIDAAKKKHASCCATRGVTNRHVIRTIERLTFEETALDVTNFRQVAKLAGVSEGTVFRVVRTFAERRG